MPAITLPLPKLSQYAVADLPDAGDFKDCVVNCTNGHDGAPVLARSNGTVWINTVTNAPVSAATLAVAALPAAATYPGAIRHCSNGSTGSACMVRSDGTNWKVIALGATASAS